MIITPGHICSTNLLGKRRHVNSLDMFSNQNDELFWCVLLYFHRTNFWVLNFDYIIIQNGGFYYFNRLWLLGYRFGDGLPTQTLQLMRNGGNPGLAPGDSSRDPDKKSRSVGGHIYNLLKGHLTTPKKQNCQAHPCVCMFLFVWHKKEGTTIRWFSPQWICKLPRHEKKTNRRLAFEYTEGKGILVICFWK